MTAWYPLFVLSSCYYTDICCLRLTKRIASFRLGSLPGISRAVPVSSAAKGPAHSYNPFEPGCCPGLSCGDSILKEQEHGLPFPFAFMSYFASPINHSPANLSFAANLEMSDYDTKTKDLQLTGWQKNGKGF
jgi:hypothetical protein